MKTPKVVAIVQARMRSSRLPGKVLLPLGPLDKSVLWWVTTRAGLAELVDEVVVATTMDVSNDIIFWQGKQNYNWFPAMVYRYTGREEDVIGRVLACANWADADIIVDLTADCPAVDPRHMDELIDYLMINEYDYVSNCIYRDFPDGLDLQVYYTKVLKKCKELFNPKQHVGWNIVQHSETFYTYYCKARPDYHWPELGLTLDEYKDYEMLSKLFNKFGEDPAFRVEDVIHYLRNNPDQITNADVRRKTPEEG